MERRLGCPVVIGYTSTEAAITTGTVPGDTPEVIAHDGRAAASNVELEVVDDDGDRCATGVVGRVRCRSGAVMRGYWRDPARTAEVLGRRRLADDRRRAVSSTSAGTSRSSGARARCTSAAATTSIPPRSSACSSAHPTVSQVAIVGMPDPVLGEIGVAFVVAGPRAQPRARRPARTREGDARRLQAPDRLVVVDALPLTAMGKVDKRALRRRFSVGAA